MTFDCSSHLIMSIDQILNALVQLEILLLCVIPYGFDHKLHNLAEISC